MHEWLFVASGVVSAAALYLVKLWRNRPQVVDEIVEEVVEHQLAKPRQPKRKPSKKPITDRLGRKV
jgi:hypothetical protein